MTAHNHRTIVAGCYRCEIGRYEARESQGWAEAEEYARHTDPSRRAETWDDFMTGWRTADRTRGHQEPTSAEFVAWADASPAVTWRGRLGLKERWEHRDDPEYQEMLRNLSEGASSERS